ncbi:MAG: hypothetical protein K6U74_09100 [Firmicutes bacterium]|nr:hypothetical protein [Bacillota bacterium]
MPQNRNSKKQPDALECLRLEMLALGLKNRQIDRIIAESFKKSILQHAVWP